VTQQSKPKPIPATIYTAHLICGCGATNVVESATYPVGTTMRARCRVCGSESDMRMGMVEIK